MGANMARRLKETGHTVAAVYDTRPGAAQVADIKGGLATVAPGEGLQP